MFCSMKPKSLTINANRYVDMTFVAANVVLVTRVLSTVMLTSSESQKETLNDEPLSIEFS